MSTAGQFLFAVGCVVASAAVGRKLGMYLNERFAEPFDIQKVMREYESEMDTLFKTRFRRILRNHGSL
ncbi:hypothetical protein COLO4_34111 [Corchorus olitorius]|uniref:Uncharacterized protein n=1 Tax=Corchorus olitorius TaxID=93759 RepID=A0A1R3GNN8_9ROSI|nr:hypothetical protein COLO4_34111 [Corchorus olitorius]